MHSEIFVQELGTGECESGRERGRDNQMERCGCSRRKKSMRGRNSREEPKEDSREAMRRAEFRRLIICTRPSVQ